MKTSHVLLLCAFVGSAALFAGFTHAGLEIRGVDYASNLSEAAEYSSSLQRSRPSTKKTSGENSGKLGRPDALGPTYPIAEPDLLELFLDRVNQMKSSGQYQKRFSQEKQKIADRMANPLPVEGLVKAQETRVWLLEASIPETLPESLLKQAASVELPKLSRELLFIDGTDLEELAAAQTLIAERRDARVVLVNGNVADVSRQMQRRIFFDQGGALTRLFGIQATPAVLFNGSDGPSGIEFPPHEVKSVLSNLF